MATGMVGLAGRDVEGPAVPWARDDRAGERSVGEGPPLCGQTALIAKISPSTLKRAIACRRGPRRAWRSPGRISARSATLTNGGRATGSWASRPLRWFGRCGRMVARRFTRRQARTGTRLVSSASPCLGESDSQSSSSGRLPADPDPFRAVTVVPLPNSELISNSSMSRRTPGRPSPRLPDVENPSCMASATPRIPARHRRRGPRPRASRRPQPAGG